MAALKKSNTPFASIDRLNEALSAIDNWSTLMDGMALDDAQAFLEYIADAQDSINDALSKLDQAKTLYEMAKGKGEKK